MSTSCAVPVDPAVLPDHRVEQLVGLGEWQVGRPDGGGPAVGGAVGIDGDPHGEAGHDQMARERLEKGSAPSATTPEPGRCT